MFDRKKAILIYRELIEDLTESKKLLQQEDNYYGINNGIVMVSKKYASKKIISNLERLAAKDNFNFTVLSVPDNDYRKDVVIYSIDNNPDDIKVKKIGLDN